MPGVRGEVNFFPGRGESLEPAKALCAACLVRPECLLYALEHAPWTPKDADAATVAAWSRAETKIQLLMAYLTEIEILDGDGSPRAASHLLGRLEAQAQSLRTDLGLSPQALSRLLAGAERRGAEHHSQDQEVNAENRRMIAEGRGVPDHVFVVLAAAAVTSTAWLLVVGHAGHGLKDFWQERNHYVANTRWWPPFCAAVDWLVAVVLVIAIAAGVSFHQ